MNNTQPSGLALEIRAEMTRQQLNPSEVSERCDLSSRQLRRRLSGEVEMTVGEAMEIAGAIGVPLFELLRRADQQANLKAA